MFNGMAQNTQAPSMANDIFPLTPGAGAYGMSSDYTLGPELSTGGDRFGYISENLPLGAMPNAGETVEQVQVNEGSYTGPLADKSFGGEPFAVWLGAVGVLMLLGWFSEKAGTLGGANPAHVRIAGYNFMAIGTIAVVFILLLKVIFNAVKLPGFTDFANAI